MSDRARGWTDPWQAAHRTRVLAELGKLVGCTVNGIAERPPARGFEFEGSTFGLELGDKAGEVVVWFQADEEGNGPGWPAVEGPFTGGNT